MSRFHNTFLGYRIYRKKFLGTVAVVVLLCSVVFFGMLFFFVEKWMGDMRTQVQNRFHDKEKRLELLQNWTDNYVNGMYEDAMVMQDLKALFEAANHMQYVQQRRENSLSQSSQIRYFPMNARQLFIDRRGQIGAVSLESDSGVKLVWMDQGELYVNFDFTGAKEAAERLKQCDLEVSSYSVRDPENMGKVLGTMRFWVDSGNIYEAESSPEAPWALFDTCGRILEDGGLDGIEKEWLAQASQKGTSYGWLEDTGLDRVFFVKMTSGHGSFSYVTVKSVGEIITDNSRVIAVLAGALFILAAGVLLFSYMEIGADAEFLSRIMRMLSDMESGHFEDIRRQELPLRHKENEYGMIAVALKDVGEKLQGYIETEYILKLKEQETQMRALQHQINPHFLYNTLEILRSKALLQGDRDMADAIALLGALYRARMHKKDRIPLGEEFELLETYLKIMSMRFRDNFVYQVELDKEIADIETISFWLQPLAENFFTHGFDRSSLYNLLIVTGHAENGGARIEVIDNGNGIAEEKLEEIRKNMYEGNDDPDADIGLRNVYMRMNYFYRDGFTMEIGNNEEGGFRISIFIPGKMVTDVHTGDRG